MSKRVVFKDGHEEEITSFQTVSVEKASGLVFETKSGIYLSAIHYFKRDDKLGEWNEIDESMHIYLDIDKSTKPARPLIDDYYLNIAKAVCKRSTCMRRHYGAVIVKNGEIISTGYNGSPRGEANCCDTGVCGREGNAHNDGDYRKCPAVHAEMNALLSAARKDTIGATLYLYGEDADGSVVDASPCPICDALIRNAGVEKVVGSHAGDTYVDN